MDAIYAIAGTIIGFILSEAAQWWRTRQNDERQTQSVRALLRLEMDRNIAILKDYQSKVDLIVQAETETDPNMKTRNVASKSLDIPMLEIKRDAYNSQLSIAATSLSERELLAMFNFYDQLDKVELLRNTLVAFASEQHDEWANVTAGTGSATLMGVFGMTRRFDLNVSSLWGDLSGHVEALLKSGNPLTKT